ncbi:MAG TPA: hypothetical protein VHL34_04820 [Rhizomicrobium sp.]|nr:hypothetical protein [Rhizomicrobium sp.]HEX2654575.1 hypothetical protein [Xanthobacteraceae bacterium]
MKKLVLHIGVKKTGSTTLQQFLSKNRPNLREQNAVYLRSPGKIVGGKFFELFQAREPDRTKVDNFTAAFRREILGCEDTGVRVAIASDEALCEMRRDSAVALQQFLSSFFKEVEIVVYLRRQDEAMASHYSTSLRGGGTRLVPLPEEPDLKLKTLHYEQMLEVWASAFGESWVRPRLYDRKELIDGDLLRDFLTVCGLNPNGNFNHIDNANTELSKDVQLFMGMLNKHIPARINGKPNPARGPLFHMFDDFPDTGKGMKPTRGEAEAFYQNFREINENVRRRWFKGREKLFDEDFSKYPEKRSDVLTPERAVEIAAFMWSKLQRRGSGDDDESEG